MPTGRLLAHATGSGGHRGGSRPEALPGRGIPGYPPSIPGPSGREVPLNVSDRPCRGAGAWLPLLGLLLLSLVSCGGEGPGAPPRPIPTWIYYPSEVLKVGWNALFGAEEKGGAPCKDFVRYRPPGFSRPVPHARIPQHPFMAPDPGSNMHCDAYLSDTYEAVGPLGIAMTVRSRTQGFGGYGTITFDRAGRLVAVYSNGRGFQLEVMDPWTLRELASYDLPSRPWYFPLQGVAPWKYIGAGMYFYLDERDRAVVPTTDNRVLVVQVPPAGKGGGFVLRRAYDLSAHVVPLSWPKRDSVAWVLPDWGGRYYWYATTGGIVGTVHRASGRVRTRRLQGEKIENAFAVAEEGAFILSDRALYRFALDGDGEIRQIWRTEYDRGPGMKPGHITRGSGTSVTLMGGADGLAVIADNAEPRIHLLFIRRSDGAVVGRVPVFEEGKSGTDLTTIGFEHGDEAGAGTGAYSVIVENNWGHHHFPRSHPVPGLTRVDAVRRGDGSFRCERVWESREKSIGGFRLSFGSGLVYLYGKDESCPVSTWYFTAVDFATGETVYRKRTGTGLGYNNWQGSLFLHPAGGRAYSTTIFGLVMLADGPPRRRP